MEAAKVKNEEHVEEDAVKSEQNEMRTVVLQNIERMHTECHEVPLILNDFAQNSDGNLEISQVEDVTTYTYILENTEFTAQDGEVYELQGEDGERYIIEEYHEEYEDSQDIPYETTEVYEIQEDDSTLISETEEIQEEFIEENGETVDDPAEEECQELPVDEQELEYEQENEELQEEVPVQEEDEVEAEEELPDRKTVVRIKEEVAEPYSQDEADENEDVKNILECDACQKCFKTGAGLKRHITVCHSDSLEGDDPLTFQICPCCGEPSDSAHTLGDFKCDQCDKLFIQQNCLDRHISLEHPPNNIFSCVECKKPISFESKEKLIDHMRIHPFKSVKCEGCGREFTRKYHLDRHIGQTGCMGAPKAAFDCRVCKKFFTRKDNLAEHLRTHAGITKKKKTYCCEFCSKVFQGYALLSIHVRTHTGEKPYPCDLCPKRFPSSGAMKKHRRMHTGEKPYKCSECDNRFAAKETLNRHVRTHTGEKPHTCKFCGKSFIQASQLRAHIFHHTGENAYSCPHCGRAFNRKLRLTTHIKFMHEGEKPLNCSHPNCEKTFFRKEDIARHMTIHSGDKPYKCNQCEKSFAVKSSLKIHSLIHRKEPPVSCDTCGRAFIRQDCLMRHMRSRHRDVLEDIMAQAEKKRLQRQLLTAATDAAAAKGSLADNVVWNELTLTESVKELLTLLVDDECLTEFGYPDAPVDRVLDSVIRRCGHQPASDEDFDYIGRMRENAKLLFTVVIDDDAVKELLNNQTVDEVILHVLRLAKKQGC